MEKTPSFSLSDAFLAKLQLGPARPPPFPAPPGAAPGRGLASLITRRQRPPSSSAGSSPVTSPLVRPGREGRAALFFSASSSSPAPPGRERVRSPLFLGRRPRKKPSVFTFECEQRVEGARRRKLQLAGVPVPSTRLSSGGWEATEGLLTVRFDDKGDRVVFSVRPPVGDRKELRVATSDVVEARCVDVGGDRVRLTVVSANAPSFWRRQSAVKRRNWPEGLPCPAPEEDGDEFMVWLPTPDFTSEEASRARVYEAVVASRYASTLRNILQRIGERQASF